MFGMGEIMTALPKLLEMQPLAEKFMLEWLGFMHKLGASLERIEATGERTENKVALVISMLNESHITPALHDEVTTMAVYDPRNAQTHVTAEGTLGYAGPS